LFPFSLLGRAKQWYAHSVRGVNGNWDELRDKFCHAFFPLSKKIALHREILNFEQKEKETLGAAWARFMSLTNSGPTLSLPKNVLLEYFYLGLNKEAALHLDTVSGGSFSDKTINERKAILEKILENTPYTGIFDEFPEEEKEIEPSLEPKDKESIPRQEKEVLIVKSQPLQSQDSAIGSKPLIPQNPPRKEEIPTLES
jgi:hypothetical protein